MKTFLILLLAIVPLVSFAQPVFRNPMTTNRFMLNLPSNLQVPAWNTAAGRWSNSTVSAGGDAGGTNSRQGGTLVGTNLVNNPNVATNILGAGTVTVTSNNAGTFTITGSGGAGGDQVWTNDAGVIQTLDYGTNVMFNPGISGAATDVAYSFNTTDYLSDPDTRLLTLSNNGTNRFQVFSDGETWIGKDLQDWFTTTDHKFVVAENLALVPNDQQLWIDFGSFSPSDFKSWEFTFRTATNMIYFQMLAAGAPDGLGTLLNPTASATETAYIFNTSLGHTSGNLAEFNNAEGNHFAVRATNGVATPQISAYGATSHPWQFGSLVTGGARVSVNGVLATLSTNVTTLITTVTTNHITFGATNAPPASAVAPTRWVSVLINGEATQYKIPLYQ